MADHPILFSAPMVRALIAGTKTQTRRLLKPHPPQDFVSASLGIDGALELRPASLAFSPLHKALRRLPRPGDRLWVREAWRATMNFDRVPPRDIPATAVVVYEAGGNGLALGGKPRASMHMPRWASRLTLLVTDVRVQRLQDISNDDCIAEGVPVHPNPNAPRTGPAIDAFARKHGLISHYGAEYRRIWQSINGAGSWDANPWVVAYTFTVHQQNIDAMEVASAPAPSGGTP